MSGVLSSSPLSPWEGEGGGRQDNPHALLLDMGMSLMSEEHS